ncbi:hypothetical protein SEA_BIG4_353 [Microbacterium phage Big4]|nr:hypothetical protein SEA_BIG4_27 [Microbacterium phage Big4]URP22386.1 hypothetical protein SEA_BIG4_353 [Microbacterium phage Big4]
MAYSEQSQDTRRMDESRAMALKALQEAEAAQGVQGGTFDRAARVAEIAVALYDADARRMGISRG